VNEALAWLPASEFSRVLDGIPGRHDRARVFSALARINALYMVTRAGSGHIGSSFSAADIVTWLLAEEMRDPCTDGGDVYFSSKGHDVPIHYAALIGLGHLDGDLVHRLRRLDGLPGHPDARTPHMPFSTGSLGMGISKAKGLVLADRLAGRRRRIFVMTGDGELQEGQNWEALPTAAQWSMGELTVLVDHNKLQSDTWVREVSDLGNIPARFSACGWGTVRCDGHDFTRLEEAFRERSEKFPDQPAVIIADTIKGGGSSVFAATAMPEGEWRYRYHSGAPSGEEYQAAHLELVSAANEILRRCGLAPLAPETSEAPPHRRPASPRLPEIYGQVLTDRATRNRQIIALDADLVLDTGLIPFREAHPARFVECGIAEQDMVSTAGGLSAGGLLPFAHSFSSFLHSRPNEQIYNNATEGRRVIYVGSLAGLLPAAPGPSHQAVRDVCALAAVPGLVVLEPASPAETEAAVDYCLATSHSVYLRLSSTPCSREVSDLPAHQLITGHGHTIRPGRGRGVAIGAGPVVLTQLLRAAELLATDGVDLTVVNLPWHNRVDRLWLADLAADAEWVFVVTDHYPRGGQADMLAGEILRLAPGRLPRFRAISMTDIPHCGADEEVLAAHGLRADLLAAAMRQDLSGTAPDAVTAGGRPRSALPTTHPRGIPGHGNNP
jgi:transketolase